jgi:uncharacterized protein
MIAFQQLYDRVIEDLQQNLPAYLTYHSVQHTLHVLNKTILIAREEMVSDDELYLLKIAALYHDTGYKFANENHESESCRVAKKELTELGFGKAEIDQIAGMIMATQIPQRPQTHLESILADADLEYLGTPDYEPISKNLYTEIKHFRPGFSVKEWYDFQIGFLKNHQYHTEFCKINREPKKIENLQRIIESFRLIS